MSAAPILVALPEQRARLIEKILARQDTGLRWGHDEKQAARRPENLYYSPNFRSTLWTLVLLADLQAPPGLPQVEGALRLIAGHFFSPPEGIFRLPVDSYFPIPCLNGNLLYLHNAFSDNHPGLESTIEFFAEYQRFDDGGFVTPTAYPYRSNRHCYGGHTCFWGVAKLLKGLCFLPTERLSPTAQRLMGNCIEFILHHRVCFRSRHAGQLLNPEIGLLTFPNFYKSDFLELLWLLVRAGVRDPRMDPALDMLRSLQLEDGVWPLQKSQNTLLPLGAVGDPNGFITERSQEVLHACQ